VSACARAAGFLRQRGRRLKRVRAGLGVGAAVFVFGSHTEAFDAGARFGVLDQDALRERRAANLSGGRLFKACVWSFGQAVGVCEPAGAGGGLRALNRFAADTLAAADTPAGAGWEGAVTVISISNR
jgi:hypothetical protein